MKLDKDIEMWKEVISTAIERSEKIASIDGSDEEEKAQVFIAICSTIVKCSELIIDCMEVVKAITNQCECESCKPLIH